MVDMYDSFARYPV